MKDPSVASKFLVAQFLPHHVLVFLMINVGLPSMIKDKIVAFL